MILKVHDRELVVFDLDDTLYKEVDFLRSAFKEISSIIDEKRAQKIYNFMIQVYKENGDAFGEVKERYKPNISKIEILDIYRNHIPDIKMEAGVREFIEALKRKGVKIGLLTDGRSNTQRNKLKALGLEDAFDGLIISEEFGSEKPNLNNYKYFDLKYKDYTKTYIADNFAKDFITPNSLGWRTIGLLDNGKNIHEQNYELPQEYLPQNRIHSFKEIEIEYV